jgi:WD40 repeat protein
MDDLRYWGFISYSRCDRRAAEWLHRSLESYRVPRALHGSTGQPLPRRLYPVFRDRDELSTSADLGAALRAALEASRALVVVCSPASAHSRWVEEEVRTFVALGRAERIFCVLVGGEPGVGSDSECLPAALLEHDGVIPRVPLAADMRPNGDSQSLVRLKLVAAILDIPLATLIRRDRRRRRGGTILAIAALSVVAAIVGWQADEARLAGQEAREARQAAGQARHEARQARQVALGRSASLLARQPGRDAEALTIGVQATVGDGAEPEKAPASAVEGLVQALMYHRHLATLHGHTSGVESLGFSPDGSRIVTGARDWTARLWDAGTGAPTATLNGHLGPVIAVAFAPDGTRVATASEDGTARVWRARDGELLRTLEGHSAGLTSVTFSLDGTCIATGSWDRSARVWAADDGRLLARFDGHAGPVSNVRFSPDSMLLATASQDNSVRLWDLKRGVSVAHVQTDRGIWSFSSDRPLPVATVAWSPDGTRFVTGSRTGAAYLWTPGGERLEMLIAGGDSVCRVAFSPDSKYLATAVTGGTVRIWGLADAVEHTTLEGAVEDDCAIAFSPNGQWLATAGTTGIIDLWDVEHGTRLTTLEGHEQEVTDLTFSPDGTRIATASRDGTARIWDATADKPLFELQRHTSIVAPSSAADRVITGNYEGRVGVWDAGSGEAHFILETGTEKVVSVHLAPSGTRYAAATENGDVWIGSPEDHPAIAPILVGDSRGQTMAFSPDGTIFATGGADGVVRLWAAATGRLQYALPKHADGVLTVVFSPDGRLLATAAADGAVRLWRVDDGSPVADLLFGFSTGQATVAFSGDGRYIGLGTAKGGAGIYEAATGDLRNVLAGHTEAVLAVAFSPDCNHFATAGTDRTARLWDVATGRLLATLVGHTDVVTSVAFSPDNARVATIDLDDTVRLWLVATAEPLAVLRSWRSAGIVFDDSRPFVAFLPDGERLLTLGYDGTTRLWAASPRAFVTQACRRAYSWVMFQGIQDACYPYAMTD